MDYFECVKPLDPSCDPRKEGKISHVYFRKYNYPYQPQLKKSPNYSKSPKVVFVPSCTQVLLSNTYKRNLKKKCFTQLECNYSII